MGVAVSIIATAVRHLMAAGVTGDALLSAIAEMEAQIRAEPKPRTSGAIRQERYRRNKSSQSVTCDGSNACDVTSDAGPSLSPSPNENNSNPHPHTHPNTKPARVKGRRLPVDWQPEPITGDLAKRIALWPPGDQNNPSAINRELAKFRDWAASAAGEKGVKSDWQAAWRNWLRRADEEGKYRDSRPQAYRSSTARSGNPDRRDGLAKACDRIIDAHTGGIDGYAFPAEQDRFGDGGGAGRALPAP